MAITWAELNKSSGATFEILDVPGHTSGHIAYCGHRMEFAGDTLFMSGCGRLIEGTAAQMYASLSRLSALPDDTCVYCAHEYTASNLRFAAAVEPHDADIQRRIDASRALRNPGSPNVPAPLSLERRTNPFLRVHAPAVIESASRFCCVPLREPVAPSPRSGAGRTIFKMAVTKALLFFDFSENCGLTLRPGAPRI